MASCEKCWGDAYFMSLTNGKSQYENYEALIKENQCSYEEQAGLDSLFCSKCERKTVHQVIKKCLICGKNYK